jgi:hypothetical protein
MELKKRLVLWANFSGGQAPPLYPKGYRAFALAVTEEEAEMLEKERVRVLRPKSEDDFPTHISVAVDAYFPKVPEFDRLVGHEVDVILHLQPWTWHDRSGVKVYLAKISCDLGIVERTQPIENG